MEQEVAMGGWQLLVDKGIWLCHKIGVGCLDGLVPLFLIVQFLPKAPLEGSIVDIDEPFGLGPRGSLRTLGEFV